MGYESRVIVTNVRRHEKTARFDAYVYAEKIVDMKMSCMEAGFKNLFQTETDYKLFIDNGNNDTFIDCYGEHIKSASIPEVMTQLEEAMKRDNYRRLAPLYGLLSSFNPEQWDCLEVVHYGY